MIGATLQNPAIGADQMGMQRRTPLWLSHHYPHEYHRCMVVGRRHICRRCAVFYPVAFAFMFAALVGLRWPAGADPWLIWLLPVPVVVEWCLEHLGTVRYSASRNTALTLLCAPAVGVGLARYMSSPGDTLFWSVVAAYAVICSVPLLIGRHLDRRRGPGAPVGDSRTGAGEFLRDRG